MTTIDTEYKFPSVEFFEELTRAANQSMADKSLGFALLKLGFEIIGLDSVKRYVIEFEGYDVNFLGEVTDFEATSVEAFVTGQQLSYVDMFRDIQENSMATGSNTFNALTMAGFPLNVKGLDQVATDKVFRFAESIQYYLDSAHLIGKIIEL